MLKMRTSAQRERFDTPRVRRGDAGKPEDLLPPVMAGMEGLVSPGVLTSDNAPRDAGESAGTVGHQNSCLEFVALLKIQFSDDFHKLCKEAMLSWPCVTQLGVTTLQLLLHGPVDGHWMKTLPEAMKKSFSTSPFRGKGIFPHKGMLSSSRTQHRQQREKLLLDGCCQVWRFWITCSLNGTAASSGEKTAPLCCTPPTSSQREAWAVIDSWVQDFCCSPIEAFAIRPFSDITKSKDIDYSGDEVSHALPLKVGELLPGLPVSGIAGTLSAVEAADPQARAWVQDPGLAMRPREEWPTTVPKARINSIKEEW